MTAIQPVSFGTPDRRLIGIFHPAAPDAVKKTGVVLCKPFGQEAIRAHRMFRVLADRLARNGHPVLRFDYYGTGDSMGDDNEGCLSGWRDDLLVADSELRARSGVAHTAWAGMRLGASVALLAAAQAPAHLSRLVLWDPVVDGKHYLDFLRAQHIATLEEAYSLPQRPSPSALARDPATYRDQAIGFGISSSLREQIERLDVNTHTWPSTPRSIVVINDPDVAGGVAVNSVCKTDDEQVTLVVLHHGTDWTTDTAGNSPIVPAQALAQLAHQIETFT
ncbi:MAG: serine aminopeptidase domain-containing protein [Hydrogenophaga sp.]